MFKQKRLTLLSLAVMLAMLMAAVMPISALADDGVPPQPEAPVVVEEPVVDEPAAEEPVVTEPVVAEPVIEEPAAEELTVPEILEAAPEGTEVVVLDEAGEAVPLVSAEAAEAMLLSDPMWCPAGAASVTADCVNALTVTDLLPLIKDKTVPGVIYFMPTYTANDAEFDGAALGTTADYAITFQGGWNGATTVGSAISFAGDTAFSNPFAVFGWNADVTINDFTVTGVTTSNNAALYVETNTGSIALNDVSVSDNTVGKNGAYVYTANGDVTINRSHFDGNKSSTQPGKVTGLNVDLAKNVTLNQVTASYNQGDGAGINALGGSATVNNSQFFFNTSTVNDWGSGLWIDSKDAITLNNVQSSFNSKHGVWANSSNSDIYVNGGQFVYNGGDGLNLEAKGYIVLNDVYTYGNGGDGADLCAGEDVYVNGSDFYWNGNGIYVRCAKNIYTYNNYYWYTGWAGLWWPYGWHGNYYGQFDYFWGGFNNFVFPATEYYYYPAPVVNLYGLYFNGQYFPNYSVYKYFYNDFYLNKISYSPNWWWWDVPNWYSGYWYSRWLSRFAPPIVTETQPMSAEIKPLTEDDLPGDLPEGKTFANAFEATVSGGIPGEVTEVFFETPEGFADGDTLTVLSWNGSEWEEVEAEIADGKVTFKVGESGIFALATP